MFRIEKRTRLWCLLLISTASANAATTTVWSGRTANRSTDTRSLDAPLSSYRALTLDLPALRTTLATAPSDGSTTPARIDLPQPDGSQRGFDVWRTAPMAPALAARYPQIRSYRAVAVDDARVSARLDDSPHGFSAFVRAPDGVLLVQPVTLGEGAAYVSFQRDALGASAAPFQCRLETARSGANVVAATPAPKLLQSTQTSIGPNVRSYRLAVGATAEYTAFFGGTVTDGMAAIVQAVNRINGIYTEEVGVQFQLVDGNDQLVFTDPGSEPYTNSLPSALINQNQTEADTVIGAANYDIGHVFSTGGGGLAQPGVTCSDGSKAKGETGLPQPTGDAFWVDYVAHEMGHQLGALHSFNDNTDNACLDQRSMAQAVEPGGGSTLMAYAGICSPGNVQLHSDAYFNAVSLEPIAARLGPSGGGATCGTLLTGSDLAPVVQPVPTYTIPMQTPFALTGSATDGDNDALTYDWEEMDLGTASPPEGDDGSRPLFRSYPPSASPTRLVPQLARILVHDPASNVPANADISGESWAETTRDLAFRLTVRDNHPGGGASVSTDALVQVTAAAGPFRITAPAAGASWISNQPQRVSWNVAGTDAAPVSCGAVDVLYSGDGGNTFALLASGVANSGSATVIAPNLATTAARVEVRCNGNIFFDISPGDFTLIADEIFKDGFDS
jgi:hypothetical protein